MDAHALLTSQGWRGKGHSLHPTSDTTGLSRPLLVSQKQNNLGVGKKQHKTSDMWWMNAFDQSLQGLDTSEQGKVVQKITTGGLDMVVKGGGKWVGTSGGLYASFVRGEGLGGTLTPDTTEGSGSEDSLRKRRRREVRVESKEEKKERRERRATKRAAKSRSISGATPDVGSELVLDEKRKLKRTAGEGLKIREPPDAPMEAKSARKAAEEAAKKPETMEISTTFRTKDTREARVPAKQSFKPCKETAQDEGCKMDVDEVRTDIEIKEERRERKRQKKLLKDAVQKGLESVVPCSVQHKKRRKN